MFKLDPTLLAAATAIAERLANDALALDPASQAKLQAIQGTVIEVRSPQINLSVFLVVNEQKLSVQSHADTPDVCISGSPLSLARLALDNDKQALLRSALVTVDGNTEKAETFQSILHELNIDWEAGLAEVVGDVPAHLLGQRLRNAIKWGRQTNEKLGQDLTDYIQEESQSLPNRFEADSHAEQLDDLRLRLDRLQARIAQLTQKSLNTCL